MKGTIPVAEKYTQSKVTLSKASEKIRVKIANFLDEIDLQRW